MAKRFTDTEKWKKMFLRKLKTSYKVFWLYLLDECSHAGIWDVDFETAEIKTGEKLSEKIALELFQEKILPFDNFKKWFIPDFIEFQYGDLKIDNRVHASVIQNLSKYNLIDSQNKPLISPLQRAMDKDKVKDMDKLKAKDKEKDPENKIELTHPLAIFAMSLKNVSKLSEQLSDTQCEKLTSKFSKEILEDVLAAMENYKDLLKKYTSVYLTINNWAKRRNKQTTATSAGINYGVSSNE